MQNELQTSRKHSYMLFVPSDFRNFEGLVAKLRSRIDPVSVHIWERLPSPVQASIMNSSVDPHEHQLLIIKELNTLLRGDSLYNRQVFADVVLSEDTRKFLTMAPVGLDLVELNRRLLEDSYPLELVKVPTASSLSDPKAILELILKVFPIGAAIVYATGFLVVSAFLDRFGINEANVEFLKVTYIQVGLLYFAFPVFVLAPIFIFFRLHNDPHATTRMPTIAVVGTLNLLFTF